MDINNSEEIMSDIGESEAEKVEVDTRSPIDDINEQFYNPEHHDLGKEKADPLKKVLEYVNEVHCLCGVLGLDFIKTIRDVHPSFDYKGEEHVPDICDGMLTGLYEAISRLEAERKSRIKKKSSETIRDDGGGNQDAGVKPSDDEGDGVKWIGVDGSGKQDPLDEAHDLSSWLDIGELEDSDFDGGGLEIPMDDLSELNLLL